METLKKDVVLDYLKIRQHKIKEMLVSPNLPENETTLNRGGYREITKLINAIEENQFAN